MLGYTFIISRNTYQSLAQTIPSILVDPHNPSYLPKHTWRGFAAFLGDVILPMNVTDTRSWLLGEGLSETFADDFLQEYPRFVRDSSGGRSDLPTIPESHYIPKSQWGTFAEFMRNVIQTQNVTSPRGWMLDNNLAENFVTDFLKHIPNLQQHPPIIATCISFCT